VSKITIWLFAVVVYGALGSIIVQSQGVESCPNYRTLARSVHNPSCLKFWAWDSLPDLNGPPTMVCCNPTGDEFGESCIAPRASCGAPANASNETCPGCAALAAGKPINLATGNTYIEESDISVPGLGGGLALSRTWNSVLPATQSASPFMFGTNWRSNFEEHLIFTSGDGYLKYVRGDGSVWSFAVSDDDPGNNSIFKAAAPATDTTTTITKGSPSWTMAFKSGVKRFFDSSTGRLVSMADRNGNTTTFAYDAAGRLSTVTDAASRHLTFNYPDGSTPLVSSVTTDVGLSFSYVYDTQGRLSQVTKPDSTTISFQYDANSNITAVLDMNGKVLESHTYDPLHRGLTSSRANGVEAVTVTYPQ
jgi:YD repeat-containing protein